MYMYTVRNFVLGPFQIMLADLSAAHVLSYLEVMKINVDLAAYPKLATIKSKVEAVPKIAAWIKERPQSSF